VHTEIWSLDAENADVPPRLETIDLLTEEEATKWLAVTGA
jgi:hypothetical protein